jgi:hypothetical protein
MSHIYDRASHSVVGLARRYQYAAEIAPKKDSSLSHSSSQVDQLPPFPAELYNERYIPLTQT